MRRFVLATIALTVLSVVLAFAGNPRPSDVNPLESLSDVDSLTVLLHFEKSGVPISRELLEHDVFRALEQAGVGVGSDGPPYLHVRVYARAGAPPVSDQDTPRGLPASWHFGMWIDRKREYSRVSGPLTSICPRESGVWSRGGTGLVTEGRLLHSVQMWLAEFVEDYQATNPDR